MKRHKRIRVGRLFLDAMTRDEAIAVTERLVTARRGGFITTPNVDCVVIAEGDEALCQAYAAADLCLADGMGVVWMSRLIGHPLPQRVSGTDVFPPLMALAARRGWRVFFVGGLPGVAARAAAILEEARRGLNVVGVEAPPFGFERDPIALRAVGERVHAATPDFVVVALGCPKQETVMHAWRDLLAPAVMIGLGSTLDYVAGEQRLAPSWMIDHGLAWFYRLVHDPVRLGPRYLWRDLGIAPVLLRSLRTPRSQRAIWTGDGSGQ